VSHNKPNFDEGINPPEDKKKQKPNKTTSGDQTGEARSDHKVEDLAKAGRDDMDTDEGAAYAKAVDVNTADDETADGKWKSTNDGSGTSETD
jgi:hypothetical protein